MVAIGSAFSGVTAPPSMAAKHEAPAPQRPLVQAASAARRRRLLPAPEAASATSSCTRRECRSAPPTARPSRRATNAYRVYPLGKHGKALAVDAHTALRLLACVGPALHDLDGRADPRAADAPGLLGQARQVRVYTNGAAIHRIAVFYGGEPCKAAGGVVVWIDNSLDDKLSPETMIAIAREPSPARRAPA